MAWCTMAGSLANSCASMLLRSEGPGYSCGCEECRTCSTTWVQSDAYTTRKECPRCERHSKLYGYRWPQTESQKGEREGRIMDHRTVNRFLLANEEARIRKSGRGLRGRQSVAAEEMDTDGGDEAEEVVGGGRRTKSGRVKWTY